MKFKTTYRHINSGNDAKIFLTELMENQEDFHPDDKAETIVSFHGMDQEQYKGMNTMMERAQTFLGDGIYSILLNRKADIEELQTLIIDTNMFNNTQTGGGCTALTFEDKKGNEYMITKHNDVCAPSSIDSLIDFGCRDIEGYQIFCIIGIKISQITMDI